MLIRPSAGGEVRSGSAGKKAGSRATASGSGNEEVKNGQPSEFLAILNEILPASDVSNLDLHGLWEKLPQAEKDVIDNPSSKNLEIYKEIVRGILKQSLNRIFTPESMEHKSRTKGLVKHDYLKILDEKLHIMTLTIQSENNSAFRILKQLEDIRGLLIDIK